MNSKQSRPAQEAGNGTSGKRLKEKIDDLIAKINTEGPFPLPEDEKERSRLLREHFVAKIWPKLHEDYDTMMEDLKKLLRNRLNEESISSEVSGRAKTVDSVKKSLQKRENDLHAKDERYFTSLEDIFQAMHDLAGLRIVLIYRDDLEKGQALIKKMFQPRKNSAHFRSDREVGQHWKRPWFGAYETNNYRLSLGDDKIGPIVRYAGVMFEIQLTTLSDDLYNKLAHDFLYKSIPGSLTLQDEMVIDLSHGLSRCFELCLRIFKGKLNTRSDNIQDIKGNEDEFTEMDQALGPGTSNEAKVALDEIIGNLNAGEFDDNVKSISERVDQILKEIKRGRTDHTNIDYRKRRGEVLRGLSILPYRDRKDRNPKPVQGTCQWFINHELFRQWQNDESSSLLWVSADPGCGKSVLAKHLVDTVLPTCETRITCYFFFKDDFEDQKDILIALRSLLHQLFDQRESLLSDAILQRFEKNKSLLDSFIGLWSTLIDVTSSANAGEIVCILDALDECHENGRNQLVEALKHLYENEQSKSTLKFAITTRPHLPIVRGFRTKSERVIHLSGEGEVEVKQISQEINLMIRTKIEEVSEQLELRSDEKRLLQDELTSIPNRTYLWVYLVFDIIAKSRWVNQDSMQKITRDIPKTVEAAYEKILNRSSDRHSAKTILHTIVAATRPFSVQEMATALTLIGITSFESGLEPNEEGRFRETLKDTCGLFITIVDSRIYLLHQTCREFLVQEVSGNEPTSHSADVLITQWHKSLRLKESNKILGEICIEHLCLEGRGGREFLQYAAHSWVVHFQKAQDLNTRKTIHQAKRLICNARSHQDTNWFRIYQDTEGVRLPERMSSLMLASYFGLEQIISLLLEDQNLAPDERDEGGRSALSFACENGYHGIVKMLLSLEVVTKAFRDNSITRTFRNHSHLAKLFVRLKGNPLVDSIDKENRTPLWYAADNGHTSIVQTLIENNAEANREDKYGYLPLSMAASNGHPTTVELLVATLGGDKYKHSRTSMGLALQEAISRKQEVVVQLLLDLGAPVDVLADWDRTPLHIAARDGTQAIVRSLLDNQAQIEARDFFHATPLCLAAGYGNEEVVTLLLDKGAQIDVKDDDNNTPIRCAVRDGRIETFTILLDRGAPIHVDRTLLHLAARGGHEEIVVILLDKGLKVDARDEENQTPLHAAINSQDSEIVALLLQNGAEIDARDIYNSTPLHLAAPKENGAAALLLAEGASIEARDMANRTPLHIAAQIGSQEYIQLLHEKGAEIDARDQNNMTPLHLAAGIGSGRYIQLLLEKGANIEARDVEKRTPLHMAAQVGFDENIQLLLEKGAEIDPKDENNMTPLHYAAQIEFDKNIQVFLEKGAEIDARDQNNRTPLHYAAIYGQDRVVDVLIQRGAQINARDSNNKTPLELAAQEKRKKVVIKIKGYTQGKDFGWVKRVWPKAF